MNHYCYVIQECEGDDACVKVGYSRDLPAVRRLMQLQIANPRRLSVRLTIGPFGNREAARNFEAFLHRELQKLRFHVRGEWFAMSAIETIKRLTEASLGKFIRNSQCVMVDELDRA